MADVDESWQRVGQAIADRMDELRLTKAMLIRAAGVSDKTLNGYLVGQPIKRRDKLWALADALRWTPDSIDRILAGDEPVALPDRAELERLAAQVEATAARSDVDLETWLDLVQRVVRAVDDRTALIDAATTAHTRTPELDELALNLAELSQRVRKLASDLGPPSTIDRR